MRTSDETLRQFEAEQNAYWRMREELLRQHRGDWVAVVNGQVVSTGKDSSEVLLEAYQKTGCEVGFTARVGYEDTVRWIRSTTTGSDGTALRAEVADELGLWNRVCGVARVRGIGGAAKAIVLAVQETRPVWPNTGVAARLYERRLRWENRRHNSLCRASACPFLATSRSR